MHKGVNVWSFPADMEMARCMALAREAGFEGIELAFDTQGPLSALSTDKEILSVLDAARRAGIRVAGLASAKYHSYSLSADSSAAREKTLRFMRRHLEAASLLGVETILVVAMSGGRDLGDDPEHPVRGALLHYGLAYERAVEGLRAVAPHAEALKVGIGIENVWNGALLSPIEARMLLDDVASPFVGMYLDVGNARKWSAPEHWVQVLGERIRMVHFKDFRAGVGTDQGFVDLLEGDVDYPAVMRELRAAGFDGWAFAEMWPPYRTHPELTVYAASRAMDAILTMPEGIV